MNSNICQIYQICMVLRDKTTILIKKDTHTDLLKIMGQIQARTGKIPTLDDALHVELKQMYRRFFRQLLKEGGFIMLQKSIWVSRHNPQPVMGELLKHLGMEHCFELIEIDGKKCSKRFLRKMRI